MFPSGSRTLGVFPYNIVKLLELLQELKITQEELRVSPVMICGGVPRDKYMKRLDNISDVDITNGTKTIDYVSQEFYLKLRKKYNVERKTMPDGHSTVFIGSLKMDFSSNFMVPNIDQILQKTGVKNPTDLLKEMYSRDFTCNALLMSLDLKHIMDPTRKGFQDIHDRKIKTCLSPEITLTSNRNRVVRAIYLACKLDFDLDNSIIEYVKKHPNTAKISTEKSMADKLNEAFTRDGDKASHLITQMGLWNYITISEKAYPYYQKFLQGKLHVQK